LHLDRIAAHLSSRSKSVLGPALSCAALLLTACGSNYRPVVSAINPVGPAGQPQKYAVVISTTGASTAGLSTIVDYSGDSILVTTNIGDNPYYLALDPSGTNAYTLNGDGTINSFGVNSSLIQSQVDQSTLPANSNATTVVSQGTYLYITQPGQNELAALATGVPPTLKEELPTGANTVYTVAASGAPRVYALLQNGTSVGSADAIETTTQSISSTLPVGVNPVYGVMTASGQRAFVMNKGSNTVTVINAQQNALDSFSAFPNGTIPVGTAPVWADFAPTLNEMVVANQGNGTTPGSVSIVSIPLCTASSLPTNPNCDASNPVDAAGFGSIVATIPVGVNPIQVAVLQDGSQAFVANAGNPSLGIAGSISVINLSTDTVVATIPCTPSNAEDGQQDTTVHGNPSFIAVTTGSPTGKAYVVSSQSHDLTIIRTDTDAVSTHVGLNSTGVQVRVSAP
jgi:DNA-binding beta-propeller fold protein YncE